MMIAPRGEEQRARIVPDGGVKAERFAKEVGCDRQVAYMQMDVSDYRACRHTCPRCRSSGAVQPAYIQGIGSHDQLTAHATPCAARTIRVDLDPEIVGVL